VRLQVFSRHATGREDAREPSLLRRGAPAKSRRSLAVALHDRAVAASGRLPEQYRGSFVDGFSHAARAGFEVGVGQSGASLQLPAQVHAIARYVFTHAFVDAMHPTMVVPIVILALAAFAAVFVRGRKPAALAIHEEEAAVA